jgi:hypothetical protein
LDRDNDNIDNQALGEACEAQVEYETISEKENKGESGSAARGRYRDLAGRAFSRRNEAALRAVPKLRPAGEELERLLKEKWNVEDSKAPYDSYYAATMRYYNKGLEHWRNIEETLKRLCSPPSV